MKQIQSVPIWDKGTTYQAEVLNVYGNHLQLNKSADFYYSLFATNADGQIGMQVSQGNLTMNEEEYASWGLNDDYVWDFIASKLHLTIIGDWVHPVIEPVVETFTEPITEELIEEVVVDETPIVEEEI